MKIRKILATVLLLVVMLSLVAFPAFAEEDATDGAVTDTADTVTEPSQSDEASFYDRVIGFISNGALWAKIGAIALGALALIAAIKSNLTKISDALSALKLLVSGKATKEETEKAVDSAVSAVRKDFAEQKAALEVKYDSLTAKYDQMTAVLSLVALQLVKSPNARTQIMSLITDAHKCSGDVAEVVGAIQEEIAAADAAEEKVETPALDAVIASSANSTDASTANTTDSTPSTAPYIKLG